MARTGRPLEYRPEFGERIIELMAAGFSKTASAAELGFHRQTLYDWAEKYPEFSDAIKLGEGKRTLFLERGLLEAENGPKVTSRIFALKNACQDEWRDRVVNEHSGPGGAPIAVTALSPDELLETAKRLALILSSADRVQTAKE